MSVDAITETYELVTVLGKPALFTNLRIKRDTVPEGLYAYDIRHDDECQGIPVEIAPFIMVNHWGTILVKDPILMSDYDGRCKILEDDDFNYEGVNCEITDFLDPDYTPKTDGFNWTDSEIVLVPSKIGPFNADILPGIVSSETFVVDNGPEVNTNIVEVIRCQDCLYYAMAKNRANGICLYNERPYDPWDFCSRGEKDDNK